MYLHAVMIEAQLQSLSRYVFVLFVFQFCGFLWIVTLDKVSNIIYLSEVAEWSLAGSWYVCEKSFPPAAESPV